MKVISDSNSALRELVVSAIAASCNVDPQAIHLSADVSHLGVDSLVILSIVTLIAFNYDVVLTSEQTLKLFEAQSLHDLVLTLEGFLDESEIAALGPPRRGGQQ